MGLFPRRYFGQRLVTIAHAMTFQIRFGHDIDAVLVAQVIPAGIVGIVAVRTALMLCSFISLMSCTMRSVLTT